MIQFNIDACDYQKNRVIVTGWAFDNENKDVTITGRRLIHIEKIDRYDVQAVFKSFQIDAKCGFKITLKKPIWQTEFGTLIFHNGQDSVEFCIPKKASEIESETEEIEYEELPYQPLISIVIPVFNTSQSYFNELISSIKEQSYVNWELCLADGGSSDASFTDRLALLAKEERKIKVVYLGKNLGISDNTNEAIKITNGEFIAFCDHDDVLHKDALYEVAKYINANKQVDYVYTDEDKLSMDSKEHFAPNQKVDFNMDLLEVGNYMNHLGVIRSSFLKEIGLLNKEFDGSQDYDLVLRVAENTSQIGHVKKILYHWRSHENSVAMNPEVKRYAYECAILALKAHFERMHICVQIESSEVIGSYKVIRK